MIKYKLFLSLSTLFYVLIFNQVLAEEMVWWEGEDTTATNFPAKSAFSPGNKEQADKLSGNAWLSNSAEYKDGEKKAFAKYSVQVPSDGEYQLWSRKFWKHGPFKWRFGSEEWKYITRDISLAESVDLRKHLTASWVFMDNVTLKKGEHQFELELTDPKSKTACFDAFLLKKGSFVPNGKLKPGEKTGKAKDGYFAWEPMPDPLTDDSIIDMRHLNEKEAGESGFVKRSGKGFFMPDGRPVRFWMVQAEFLQADNASIDRGSRRLAKYGVNLVRMQLSDFFHAEVKGDVSTFNKRLERLHYAVAALKKQGIYTYLGHLYWHTHNKINESVFPGFGVGVGENAVSLIFFSDTFQGYYKQYVSKIMTPKNPYTGTSLAKESAVAFFEIHNETGIFFYTFKPKTFPESELSIIETKFGEFLTKKYGSIQKASDAWGATKGPHTPDKFDQGRAGLYPASHLTGEHWAVTQRNPKRAADQTQFMHESVYNFYSDMKKHLNKDLGLGQMIIGSNWKSAEEKNLGGIERNANRAGDAICRNTYFGVHYKKGAQGKFYAVELNDTFRSASALKSPAYPAPFATPQVADLPFMITENSWTRPNRYRSEWPFMVATYAQMTGIDGWNFFAFGSAEWQNQMAVWDVNNPSILGQFPATALMFRRGDVQEAEKPVVHEKRSYADVYGLKGTEIFAVSGKDALWVSKIGDKEGIQTSKFGVDPRAFFIGPVVQEFHDGESVVEKVDLSKYIDNEKKHIRSVTNELDWDYGNGVITVNTPLAQGASGFLSTVGKISIGDIVIEAKNEYATVLAVSLDGKPLKSSQKILVQVGTSDLPYGFETQPDGDYERITNLGGSPLNVKRIECTITLPSGTKATVLDENGYRTKRMAQVSTSGEALQVVLPEDSIYTLIE